MLCICITLIVVMVSWVFAYVQIHHIVHTQHVQFFVYQLYFSKVYKKQTASHVVKNKSLTLQPRKEMHTYT